jgi:hypothetical protein
MFPYQMVVYSMHLSVSSYFQTCSELNIKLLDIIDEYNLHQLVNVPTRKERTLDLILVTNPSIINKVHTLPPLGLSDHDVVYIEADIWLRKVRQKPRKILRYDKANWDNIKSGDCIHR